MRLPAEARATFRCARVLGYSATTLVRYRASKREGPDPNGERLETHRRRFFANVLKLLGVDVSADMKVPPAGRARLVVANHSSALDIAVMQSLFGGAMVSRADLKDWPVLGALAQEGRTIFVDRDDEFSGVRAIRAMRRRLQSAETLVVFPEGTTHHGEDLLPFQAGAFVATRSLDVDIIPAAIAYDHQSAYVDRSFASHMYEVAAKVRTRVRVEVGLPLERGSSHKELVTRAEEAVRELLRRARSHRHIT